MMKKHILLTWLLMTNTGVGVAQQWYWQNFYPQGNNQNSVLFISKTTGWIVGDFGTMLKTTDGGIHWQIVELDTHINVNKLCFRSEQTGFAVGDHGLILSTTDGGDTWNLNYHESGANFHTIYFSSSTTGWIGGDIILKTTDGGMTWNEIDIGLSFAPYSIHFYSENYGWMVGTAGDGNILRTTDGGNTWESTHLDNRIYSSVFALSETTACVALNFSEFMRTTDGGKHWEKQVIQRNGADVHFTDIFFTSDSIGWMTGGYPGVILKTTNGGKSWQIVRDDIRWGLNSVYFTDVMTGWAVGDLGIILTTHDGGDTWQENSRVTAIPIETFKAVDFVSETTGWAVGFNGLLMHTTNSGRNWVSQETGRANSYLALDFIDESTGWIAGSDGIILKTENGGKDWTPQYSNSETYIHSIKFFSPSQGIATINNHLLLTTDGGVTWTPKFLGYEIEELGKLFFFSENIGWIPDNYKNIYKTINGGESWTKITIPVNTDLPGCEFWFNSIFFIDENIGWIVGNAGIILTTRDGGNTWSEQLNLNDSGNDLYSVYFCSETTGWAAGRNGILLHTIDCGVTWNRVLTHTNMDLNDLCFVSDTGWIVGKWGTILSTVNANVTDVQSRHAMKSPARFLLLQNYPNPFNPSTEISYQLAIAGNVKLSIHNLLGQEIKTLVNGFQNSGEYTQVWDGTDENNNPVSSGVYFYRLLTDEMTLQKKMLLVR